MNINDGIDLALQLKTSRAFEKLAAMKAKEYAKIEEQLNNIFGELTTHVDAAAIAQLENIFGS
jgi:hypothetical protein